MAYDPRCSANRPFPEPGDDDGPNAPNDQQENGRDNEERRERIPKAPPRHSKRWIDVRHEQDAEVEAEAAQRAPQR